MSTPLSPQALAESHNQQRAELASSVTKAFSNELRHSRREGLASELEMLFVVAKSEGPDFPALTALPLVSNEVLGKFLNPTKPVSPLVK